MNLVSFLFLSLLAFSGEQKPFCPETWQAHMKEVEMITEISQYLGRPGKSPFVATCRGKNDMNNPIPTGIARLGIPSMDNGGVQTSDFFIALLTMIEEYAMENIRLMQNVEVCLTGKVKHEDCNIVKQWADVDVPERVKEARYELSLAADADAATGKDLYLANGNLDPLHTFKLKPWEKLTPEESARANSVLKKYGDQARVMKDKNAANKGLLGQVSYMDDRIREKRVVHLLRYRRIISELPMMNYITSANPDRGDIVRAATYTRFNAEKELEKIREMKAKLIQNPRFLDAKLLDAINYTSVLETLLYENPKFCRLGAYFYETKANREMAGMIATLPLMAASFFVAPPVAVGLGVAVGTAWYADSQIELNATKQRNLSEVYGSSYNNDEMRDAKFNRDMNLALLPLSAVGGAGASKFAQRLQKLKALKLGK